MKVNIGILRIIIASALPVPVSKRKILKKLGEEDSISCESFSQSQMLLRSKRLLLFSFKFGKCGGIGSFKKFEQ